MKIMQSFENKLKWGIILLSEEDKVTQKQIFVQGISIL